MKAKKAARGIYSVIDPAAPWKLPKLNWGFPKYPYTMSGAEWKDLVARAKLGDAEAEYLVAIYYSHGCKDRRGRILVRVPIAKLLNGIAAPRSTGMQMRNAILACF